MVLLTYYPTDKGISQLFGVNSTLDPAYMASDAYRIYGNYQPAGHGGTDFRANLNDPVYATHDGRLDFSGDARDLPDVIADKWMQAHGAANWPSGNAAFLDAGDGTGTSYAHMNSVAPILDGSWVKAGTVIGYAGTTGRSTGVHVHFEYTVLPSPNDGWLYGRSDPLQHYLAGQIVPIAPGGQGGTVPKEELLIPGVEDLYVK